MTRDYATLAETIAAFKGYTAPRGLSRAVDRLIVNDHNHHSIADAAEPRSVGYFDMAAVGRSNELTRSTFTGESQETSRGADGQLEQWSARQLAQAVGRGGVSATDIAKHFYRRATSASDLNAFISLDEDLLMRDARAVEAMLASGHQPLPLAGVPVAVADVIAVRGYPTTDGTKVVLAAPAAADADVVQRLRRAGALLFGKTNVDELGYAATGLHCPYGRVRNPAAPLRITGGSSCGSAAAVAAGLAPVALGTDTGGALRVPASCCGLVGLKPTIGAIDLSGYSMRSPTLDVVGPMTRSVADAVLMWEVMADRPPGSLLGTTDRIGPFTFLKPGNYFFDDLQDDVAHWVTHSLDALAQAGCRSRTASIPAMPLSPAAHFMTVGPEAADAYLAFLRAHGGSLGEDLRARLEAGLMVQATDYLKAQRIRKSLLDQFLQAAEGADVMITPTLCVPPPLVDEESVTVAARASGLMGRFTGAMNVMGVPAVTIPCTREATSGPIGLQIVGRPGDERSVLRAAYFAERCLREA